MIIIINKAQITDDKDEDGKDVTDKEFSFAVESTLKSISDAAEIPESEWPKFDDEFAKTFGDFKTAEELREKTGHTDSIFTSGTRPTFDPSKMVADSVKLAVQVNGKVRGIIETSPTASQDEVMTLIKADDKIAARLT